MIGAHKEEIPPSALRLMAEKFGLIGSSPAMQEAMKRLMRVSPTDIPVLLTGESGTGKEVFARAVHGLSKRAKKPMLSLNCGAIPETLLEAELFGNKKGAYTGAVEERKGFFESADGGTLFLDEIGETSPSTQVKLLRVLETGEFSRLGASDVLRADVRIIAATNRTLEEEVRRGNFRQDLFYRLNAFVITLPPLRSHTEDIPFLAEHFARRAALRYGFSYQGISSDALLVLQNLPWEGNIRELRNMVETVVTLHQGKLITPDMLREFIPPALTAAPSALASQKALQTISGTVSLELVYQNILELRRDVDYLKMLIEEGKNVQTSFQHLSLPPFREKEDSTEEASYSLIIDDEGHSVGYDEEVNTSDMSLAYAEKVAIVRALQIFDGNRRKAAHALGISERTLYRKIAEYDIDHENL